MIENCDESSETDDEEFQAFKARQAIEKREREKRMEKISSRKPDGILTLRRQRLLLDKDLDSDSESFIKEQRNDVKNRKPKIN